MKNKNTIAADGSCPFSVSSNLSIDVTSYDLNLDGIIIRYGSTDGFHCQNLVAPFHAFLMNCSDHEIAWEVSDKNGSKRTMVMKQNNFLFNPANCPFSRSTKNHYEFILVLIEPEKMISSAQIVEKQAEFKEIYNINDPHLEYIFKLLLSEVQLENKNGTLFIENLISLLSLHFMQNYTITNSNLINNVDGFTKAEYEKALLYIDKNLTENLKLDQLANEIGMDKFSLIRKFKSSVDVTPYQCIIQRKLERSKHMLNNPRYTLTDISYLLNFSDQAHFSNTFKKMYGVTPNKFRKNITK